MMSYKNSNTAQTTYRYHMLFKLRPSKDHALVIVPFPLPGIMLVIILYQREDKAQE
jgi:hypothetical protein